METASEQGVAPYRLATLGTLELRGPEQALVAADRRQQRRRLALIAVLASAGDRGRSRDQLLLLFWPDSTEKKARHSLDQLLYAIRTSLGESVFTGVNPVRLNPSVIDADVRQFESDIDNGNLDAAIATYHGPFLDGFHPGETREFEDWLDSERQRLAAKYLDALEKIAASAERNGDIANAVRWRRRLTEIEPLSTRHALELVRTLASAGDFAAALEFAARYERIAQRELGVDNIPELKKLVAEIRTRPPSALPALPVSSRPGIRPENPRRSNFVEATPTAFQQPHNEGRRFPIAVIGGGLLVAALAAGLIAAQRRPEFHPDNSQRNINATQAARRNASRAANGTRNLAAYDFYQRGLDPVLLRNDSSAQLGLQYFEKAIELDSGFAAAHAALSSMYARLALATNPSLPQAELRRRGEAAARKAIALDDSLAEGHQALGFIELFWLTDPRAAETELDRALALDPHLPHTLEYLALTHLFLGKSSQALSDAQRAVADDPLSPINKAVLAQMLYVNGRCKEALPILDSLNAIRPALLRVAVTRSLCFANEERWSDAADAVRDQAAHDKRAGAMLGFSLARDGRRNEALEIRSRLSEIARSNISAFYDVAMVSFGLGDLDDAFRDMDRAQTAAPFPYELMGPVFDSLRHDARFRPIANRRGIRLASASF